MSWSQFLNMDALREITDGDPDIERTFVEMFMKSLKGALDRLAPLVEYDPGQNWPGVIHELKGVAANIRAETLHGICRQAEQATDRAGRQAAYEKISAEYARYRQALATPPQ